MIGRNEGWKLTKCLDSIFAAIEAHSLIKSEVIYVDSHSTDDSIERALQYQKLKVVRLTGSYNPAIARNTGVNISKGQLIYFLDGDMELIPSFINEVDHLREENKRFISGQIIEHFYNEAWELLDIREMFPEYKTNTHDVTNGGAFIIDRELWESVHGMRTKYDRSQDVDFNYRMTRKGYRIFRSKNLFVKHHTIQYDYQLALLGGIKEFRKYLFRGLLIRDHLLNNKIIKRNLRINYSLFLLLSLVIIACFVNYYLILILYLLIILFRSFRQFKRFRKVIKTNFLKVFLNYIYRDIVGILGIMLFFPKKKSVSYELHQR